MASRDPARRRRRILPLVLAGAVLCCALATPRASTAGDVAAMGYLVQSAGLRQSFSLDRTGLDLRLGLGGYIGIVGLELESGWTADHPFHELEHRTAARHTTWLNLQVRIRGGPIRVVIGAGGGLGWIKEPDSGPQYKYPSQGLHEYIEFDILPVWDDHFGFGIRIEPQHLWQAGVAPRVEHSLTIRAVFWFGGYAD